MRLELASPKRPVAFEDWAMPRTMQDPVAGRMAPVMRNNLHTISGNFGLLARALGDDAGARQPSGGALAGVDIGTWLNASVRAFERSAGASSGTDINTRQSVFDAQMAICLCFRAPLSS